MNPARKVKVDYEVRERPAALVSIISQFVALGAHTLVSRKGWQPFRKPSVKVIEDTARNQAIRLDNGSSSPLVFFIRAAKPNQFLGAGSAVANALKIPTAQPGQHITEQSEFRRKSKF